MKSQKEIGINNKDALYLTKTGGYFVCFEEDVRGYNFYKVKQTENNPSTDLRMNEANKLWGDIRNIKKKLQVV